MQEIWRLYAGTGGRHRWMINALCFMFFCSCITGPDIYIQVRCQDGVGVEVREVLLLLHGLKPAPKPLLHPLQLCSVPLSPHNRGEQVPAVNADIVPRSNHPLSAKLHRAELLHVRLVHRPGALQPWLGVWGTSSHPNWWPAS